MVTALLINLLVLQKENAQTKKTIDEQIEALQEQIDGKNSYYNNFKKDDVVKDAIIKETQLKSAAQGYDKIFEVEDETADPTW